MLGFLTKISMGAWLRGLAIFAVVAIVGAASLHYRGLVADLEDKATRITELEVSLSEQRLATAEALDAADDWQDYFDRFEGQLDDLAILRQDVRDVQNELRETLRPGRLREAAAERPELVEGIVNRGTERGRRLLECASGADRSCEPGETGSTPGDDTPPGP